MMIGSKIPATAFSTWAKYLIGSLMIALGVAMVALGAKVAKDQKLQGGVGIAAGLGIIALGIYTMVASSSNEETDTSKEAGKTDPNHKPEYKNPDHPDNGGTNEKASATTKDPGHKNTLGDKDGFMGVSMPVLLGGGLVAASMIAMQMSPPKTKMVEKGTKVDDI